MKTSIIHIPSATYILTINGWKFINKDTKDIGDIIIFNRNKRRQLDIPRSASFPHNPYRDKTIKRIIFQLNKTEVSMYYDSEDVTRFPILPNTWILENSNAPLNAKALSLYIRFPTNREREAYFYIYGMLLTDGSIYKNQENTYELYQGKKNARICEYINQYLNVLGIKCKVYKRQNNQHYTWRFQVNERFFPFLRDEIQNGLGLPFFLSLKATSIDTMLKAMIDADGTMKENWTTGGFYKPSLVSFFRLLLFFRGYHSTIPSSLINDHADKCHFSIIKRTIFKTKHDIQSRNGRSLRLPFDAGIMLRQNKNFFII